MDTQRELQAEPAQWKKGVTGSGNPTQIQIQRALEALFAADLTSLSEHEIAAVGVALTAGRAEQTRRKIEAAKREEDR